jgi:hypothetical protein
VRCDARLRPGFTVRPHTLTWSGCVFALHAPRSDTPSGFVAIGADELGGFLAELDAGALDAILLATLRAPPRARLRRLTRSRHAEVAIGVEQELRVVDRGDPVDFRTIVHTLGIDGVRADPTDPNAYRCPWGGVVTCDGPEAELATPPVTVAPGFVEAVEASLRAGHAALRGALPPDHGLVGFSTHLNVSVHRRRDVAFARRYAHTFAPALMLTLDRADSPGLLVRPRPGRLELGGEYAEGVALRAAIAFAAGSVLALDRGPRGARPPHVALRLERARERFGFYVDRRATGTDLYRHGRASTLSRPAGSTTAGVHLAECWDVARGALAPLARASDLVAMDRVAAGLDPLPVESDRRTIAS